MKSTVELLDAVKARLGLPSDYALQKVLGVTKSQISRYRTGQDYLGEETAMKVPDILELNRGVVLAWVAGERARMPSARAAWFQLAARIGVVFLVVTLAYCLTEPLYNESFFIKVEADCFGPLCIMLNPHIGFAAGILFILFNLLPFIPNKKN